MKALTDAINTATAVKSTVSTIVEAEAAAGTLNYTIATFRAAFKIGTYTSSSGGSNASTTPPAITDPHLPTDENISIAPSKATVTVSAENVTDAIKKAQNNAKKNGTEKNGITVTITLDTNQTLNAFSANLPTATQWLPLI